MSEAGRRMTEQAMRKVAQLYNIAWDEAVGNPAEEKAKTEENKEENDGIRWSKKDLNEFGLEPLSKEQRFRHQF